MNNFNTNLYETKREIINYSNKITEGLKKPTAKFIMDMLYGLSKNQSVMLSDISRALDENIKINYTIDRLSKNLEKINDEELEIIRNNYNRAVLNEIDEEPLVLLDDSEIIKKYGKKFENLCKVRDASSLKDDIYPGYHVCEATAITKKEKQPISLYSHIYSTESKEFKSMNGETLKSIEYIKSIIEKKCTFVCDRGYDANIYYEYFLKEDKEVYVSHTRVELPLYKGTILNLVIV